MNKKEFLTSFFSRLNGEGVDYFVYGSYLSLPDDTGGSDIDMVVSEQDFPKVRSVFRSLTEGTDVSLVSFYANANAKFYRFLFFPQSFGVQIDIFYKGLCYKGVEYYPMRLMRERVITYNDIKVLDIKKGYYVDYIKEVLHLGRAKEKYLKAFLAEIDTDREYYRKELTNLYGAEVARLVFDNLTEEKQKNIQKPLQHLLQKAVLQGKQLRSSWRTLTLLKRLFGKRPGYVIVVEGTDGSGKSFIINSVTPILNEAFHNGVVYNHLRPNAIPDLGVLLGKKEKEEGVTVCSDPHGQKQSGLVGSLVRWGYYMIDYTLGYLKTVWPQIHTKSKVYIFDRYYYEFYLDQKRSRTNLPQWVVKLGELFLPKPDLILCLGGDPAKIYARKPETSLEEVTRQTNALRAFCNQRPNAVWVDTTLQPEESISLAMGAIYNMMNKRFEI